MKYQMQDIETLMNSESTRDLLALLEKHQDDPALIDSLIIALEMILTKYPSEFRQQVRSFAFSDKNEIEH